MTNGYRPGTERDRAGAQPSQARILLALVTAFIALIGVGLALVVFGRGTRALQTHLADTIEPANAALLDLQRVLGLQMSSQRGFQLGGARESLENYRMWLAEEERVYERLAPLAHAIGPAATETLGRIRSASARWHEVVEHVAEEEPRRGFDPRLSSSEGYFAEALRAAGELARLIETRADASRAEITRREHFEDGLIVTMLLLAGVSIAVLARLGQRFHVMGVEARRIAQIAEARHRALLRASEEKEAFIRGITHDLKNPLGVIDGSAELLEIGARGELSPEQREFTTRIRRAAHHMLVTISDLLELSRVDAATPRPEMRPARIDEVVRDAVETYRQTLEANGLEVRVNLLRLDAEVVTDPHRVREILGNLLTNAARHTPAGGRVNVSIEQRPATAERGPSLAIRVADNGPGIPPDLRDRIFREFERGPDSTGSGLGLAIGRRLARMLGGDLVLEEPPPGGGAVFALLLPFEAVQRTEAPEGRRPWRIKTERVRRREAGQP